jgi:predicted Zn-dependent protease
LVQANVGLPYPPLSVGAVRFTVRRVGLAVALIALPVAARVLLGRAGLVAGVVVTGLMALGLRLWLPRLAHRAFTTGRYRKAQRRYRWLDALATSAPRERAAWLSRAGALIALGDITAADRLLATIDPTALSAAERAVWLNNRACADLASARDATAALALADEAVGLRPDVPALHHTRALALLALGRADEAIVVLDGMRAAGELPPRLEADRCRELARAWATKGETAYADDYRLRATAYAR